MNMWKWGTGLLLAMSLLFGATGCAVSQNDIHGFNLVSVEEEKQLGAKFAVEIEKKYPPVRDPEVQGYVNKVGKQLLTGAREVAFDYTFTAVHDDSVNAFAIPGGHLYVHTGLLKVVRTEGELAGVMAHEISHAVARHGTQQLTQQYGYSLVVQLLLGSNPNLLAQIAASLAGQAGMQAYSRGMENQADYLGVETMAKAGYNPDGMLTFFTKLESMEGRNPGQLAQFFSSHPLTSERVQQVKAEIDKLPPQKYPYGADSTELKRIQAKLR
jgi:predicted Zn-dependent protease